MLSLSFLSLSLFSFIYWAKKFLIFSWSAFCLNNLLSSICLYLISFSFSYLKSMSSSNFYFLSILCKTLSAILFMNSWALLSRSFISSWRSFSYFSSILVYSSWALRSWSLWSSSSSFCLLLFLSFSSSIFWRYSFSCFLFSSWIYLSFSISDLNRLIYSYS